MLNRRQLLTWAGLTGAAATLGLGAAMTGRAAGAPGPTARPGPRARGTSKRLLVVLASGGWDTTYVLDPKAGPDVDVPAGRVRRFGDLDLFVDASRPNVTAFFERYAARSAVVRGISLSSIAHGECLKRILTGTRVETSPDVAAIVAHDRGRDLPLPYLILGDQAFTGPYAVSAGRVGATNQLVTLLDPSKAFPIVGATGAAVRPSAHEQELLAAHAAARAERERATRGALGYNRRRVDDFVEALDRGEQLRGLAAGFGARGRALALTAQADLAIDVLRSGIAQTAMLNSRVGWDAHADITTQTASHETLYAGLQHLADALAAEPGLTAGSTMLDDTVVVVASEMSRTPKLNAGGGKDHWPVTSMLVFGGGVRGGRAYGATTRKGEAASIDLATGDVSTNGRALESKHVAAGVLSLCGVEPATYLPAAEVFDAFVA
ncbi:MAG: DUF1501 domain-containing protein [Kofleriaceae bacterium]|nr:DUF1501 domain-containing protein [Kofleriaceae bacterium]MBP9204050.1 DUF1501 domain-containing protein [Kofleriaceae bacterium]